MSEELPPERTVRLPPPYSWVEVNYPQFHPHEPVLGSTPTQEEIERLISYRVKVEVDAHWTAVEKKRNERLRTSFHTNTYTFSNPTTSLSLSPFPSPLPQTHFEPQLYTLPPNRGVDNYGRDKNFPIFIGFSDEEPANSLLQSTEYVSDSESSTTEPIDVDVAHQIFNDQTQTAKPEEFGTFQTDETTINSILDDGDSTIIPSLDSDGEDSVLETNSTPDADPIPVPELVPVQIQVPVDEPVKTSDGKVPWTPFAAPEPEPTPPPPPNPKESSTPPNPSRPLVTSIPAIRLENGEIVPLNIPPKLAPLPSPLPNSERFPNLYSRRTSKEKEAWRDKEKFLGYLIHKQYKILQDLAVLNGLREHRFKEEGNPKDSILALFYVLNLTPPLCVDESKLRKSCLEYMSSEIEIDFWKTDIIPTLIKNAAEFVRKTKEIVRSLHTLPEICRGQAEEIAVERISETWVKTANGLYTDTMKKREEMLFSLFNVVLADAAALLFRLETEREHATEKVIPKNKDAIMPREISPPPREISPPPKRYVPPPLEDDDEDEQLSERNKSKRKSKKKDPDWAPPSKRKTHAPPLQDDDFLA
jgi:hypothetical protein